MMSEKKGCVPKLRFPEFSGEWEEKRLGDKELSEILDKKRKPITSIKRKNGKYPYYGASGIIDYVDDYIFEEELLLIGEDGAKWGAFEKTSFIAKGKYWVNNHTHVIRTKKINKIFLQNYINMMDLSPYITGYAPPKLNLENLKKIKIYIPTLPEQQKIADCLSSLDEVIENEEQKLTALQKHKKGLMQRLFPQEGEKIPSLRFPEFSGEWEEKAIYNLLQYERPEQYIVNSDNYEQEDGVPVLTANKSFILGYTREKDGVYTDIPAIIFDDFTTDKKYVNFPFKVKSSAIKILKAKEKNNLKFLFELMNLIRFDPTQHKRYYISEYQYIKIYVPNPLEQQKIADCLSSLDELIELQTKKIELLKKHKKGLMQGLFPSEEDCR
jgi:type I restriction enzyme S subunit